MGQLIQQHVNVEESSAAMDQIFPPDMFFGSEQQILQGVKNKGFNQEMDDLVSKFTQGNAYLAGMPGSKQQSESYKINQRTNNQRSKSKQRSGEHGERKMSKEKKKTDIDKISAEVERQLKLQRKQEKDSIKNG